MLPARGRPGTVLLMTVERHLTAEDIINAEINPGEKVAAPTIQKLKASHHAAARYLAAGRTIVQTADLVGYTPQRVGDMARNDESFKWLVSYYREQIDDTGIDEAREFQGKLKDISRIAMEEIQSRLNDDKVRQEISMTELRHLTTMGADRTVAPPKATQPVISPPAQITFNIGSRDLRSLNEQRTIDHEPAEHAKPPPDTAQGAGTDTDRD